MKMHHSPHMANVKNSVSYLNPSFQEKEESRHINRIVMFHC